MRNPGTDQDRMGILSAVKQVAPSLHKAGTFPTKTFDVLMNYLAQQKISYSVETGSGASTLLFSHFSKHHTVFALDNEDGSITNIRENPLLHKDTVTFVQGPTQRTLPFYQFKESLQAALIDGPHGYPFPDLDHRPLLSAIVQDRLAGKPPAEIAAAVAYLASPRADYVSGATIRVDGGTIRSVF